MEYRSECGFLQAVAVVPPAKTVIIPSQLLRVSCISHHDRGVRRTHTKHRSTHTSMRLGTTHSAPLGRVIEVRSPGGKSNPSSPPPTAAVAATSAVNFGLPTVTDGKSPALKHTKQLFHKTLQQIHVIKAFEGNHLNYDTLSITAEFVPNAAPRRDSTAGKRHSI